MSLDIGTVRVGIALASGDVRIALPYDTIEMNEATFSTSIDDLVRQHTIDVVVVGYPRNQSGQPTAQTAYIEKMVHLLKTNARIEFQDESLSSVMAEQRLSERKKGHAKSDVDAEAAAIILQDYLETHV